MKEIVIKTFDEYRGFVEKHKIRQCIYRGQNNSRYELKSSLLRTFSRSKNIRFKKSDGTMRFLDYEKEMLETFKRNGHIYLSHFPNDDANLDWMALMQHYGAPTRLLDFTFSPYIALYFAISGGNENDAAVFCIDYGELIDRDIYYDSSASELFANEDDIDNAKLTCYEPKFINERLFAQQGVFLIPNTLKFSHEEIFENCDDSDEFCTKIIIKASCFKKMIVELYKMNITASTVFPGFEGFCKSFENLGVIPINSMKHLPDLDD